MASTEEILNALQQLRSDLITVLLRIETEITALEYAVLSDEPVTSDRLQKLQEVVKMDMHLQNEIRTSLERSLRRIP